MANYGERAVRCGTPRLGRFDSGARTTRVPGLEYTPCARKGGRSSRVARRSTGAQKAQSPPGMASGWSLRVHTATGQPSVEQRTPLLVDPIGGPARDDDSLGEPEKMGGTGVMERWQQLPRVGLRRC